MATIDTRRAQLTALGTTGAPAAAVARALALLDQRDSIHGQRYLPERVREELEKADAAAAADLRAVIAEVDASIGRTTADELLAFDRARSAAAHERRQLRDVVDVERLRESDSPEELLGLVRDAYAAGDIVGAEAARIAEQHIRAMALQEQRLHIQNGKWFATMCALGSTPRTSARSDIERRGTNRRKQARAQVEQVAAVVGLAAQLKQPEAQPTNVTPAPRSAPVYGRFWEKFPQLAGR